MTDPVRVESDTVWNGQGTTPAAIEAALEEMLIQCCGEADSYVPARALNVVYIVEKHWKGEIANRVREVGGFHASRNIACAVEPRRTSIDAIATMSSNVHPRAGEFALLRETVIIDVGEQHLPYLDTIVGPLLVRDVPTILWSPHGHREAVDVLLPLANVVLLDSIDGLGNGARYFYFFADFLVEIIDAGDVGEVIESQFRVVAQKLRYLERMAVSDQQRVLTAHTGI